MPAIHGGPSLPNELLKQLGVGPISEKGAGKTRNGFQTRSQGRKDRRKQERQDKKGHNGGTRSQTNPISRPQSASKAKWAAQTSNTGARTKSVHGDKRNPALRNARRIAQAKAEEVKEEEEEGQETFQGFESDDDVDEDEFDDLSQESAGDGASDSDNAGGGEGEASAARLSKADRERLARDDAEIARLERKLGMKGKKVLPKSFQEDGLGDLLGELDDDSSSETDLGKRKRNTIDDEWLTQKRMKLAAANVKHSGNSGDGEDEVDSYRPLSKQHRDSESMDQDDQLSDLLDLDTLVESGDEFDEDIDDENGYSSEDGDGEEPPEVPRQRENPYIAPVTASTLKYVPPSLRAPAGADAEASKITQRKAQGLVNKMTEASFLSILGDIEKLYQESPRQYATDAIINTYMAQLTDRSSLQGTMLILYAGFATALYKVIGPDFGGHLVQRAVGEFKTHYEQAKAQPREHQAIAKQPSNLIIFMTQLYMFRMIGSKLIFDYIRMLLAELTELHAELLLQILRNSGQRLRSEDPLALKDILGLIRPAVERAGGKDKLSVRTRFMIDTMYDLKNNKVKSRTDPSHAQNLDNATRLNKALGTLNTRKLKATEPLRVSLEDIEQLGKKGQWWRDRPNWAGADATKIDGVASKDHPQAAEEDAALDSDGDADYFPDLPDLQKLNELAKAEGMNTHARYAIFRSLLVSTDSHEAYLRLQRLRLNKVERREIPAVIIQCSGSEVQYNRFYTEVAQRVCSDHKTQWGFQDALWKLFKRVGETLFDQDDGEDDAGDDEDLDVERLTNVGMMYGALIANGALGIRILKCLNFAMLRPKTQSAVLAIIIGLLRERVRLSKGKKEGKKAAIREPFLAVDTPGFARGLKYFLKKIVRKAQEVKKDKRGLSEAVAVAEEALVEVETRESE